MKISKKKKKALLKRAQELTVAGLMMTTVMQTVVPTTVHAEDAHEVSQSDGLRDTLQTEEATIPSNKNPEPEISLAESEFPNTDTVAEIETVTDTTESEESNAVDHTVEADEVLTGKWGKNAEWSYDTNSKKVTVTNTDSTSSESALSGFSPWYIDQVFPAKKGPLAKYREDIQEVEFIATFLSGDHSRLFADMPNLKTIRHSRMMGTALFEKVTHADEMFSNTSDITKLDGMHHWTSLQSAYRMFYNGSIHKFVTSDTRLSFPALKNGTEMFYSCGMNLRNAPTFSQHLETAKGMFSIATNYADRFLFADFNASPSNLSSMFERYRSPLDNVSLKGLDTSHATDVSRMFAYTHVENLDKWLDVKLNTANVTNFDSMFAVANIPKLRLNFNTANGANMSNMFVNSSIEKLDISSFSTKHGVNQKNMFLSAPIRLLNLGDTFRFTSDSALGAPIDVNGKPGEWIPHGQKTGTFTTERLMAEYPNTPGKMPTGIYLEGSRALWAPYVRVINDTDEVLSGSGKPGARVTAQSSYKDIGSGTVDTEGNFTIKIDKVPAHNTVIVRQEFDDETSPATSERVRETLNPPGVNPVSDVDETVSGTAKPGATVTAEAEGKQLGSGTVDTEGNFTIKIAKQAAGTKISVTQTYDRQTSQATDVTVKESLRAPEVNPVSDVDETVSGTAKPGATVTAKAGDKQLGTGTVDKEGKYTIKIAKQAAGTKIAVTQELDGETSSVTEVTVKESLKAPEVNPVSDVDEAVSGTAKAGATVTAKAGDKQLGTGTVDKEGNFTIKIAKQAAGTKIAVTQELDGETSPATELTVTHKEVTKNHVFHKGYWEAYGLVLNGQVDVEGLDMSTTDSVAKALELVNADGEVKASVPAVNTNWYTTGQYNGYQAILTEAQVSNLDSDNYRLQVRVTAKDGQETVVDYYADPKTAFGIQDYQDEFLSIPKNVIGIRTVEPTSNNGYASLTIESPDKPIMGLISEGQVEAGRYVNGYVLNTDFDFSKEHQKNVVIEDKPGNVVKELKNIHTWDLTDWQLGINGLQMKSGFQLIIPTEYQNTSLYQYKLQIHAIDSEDVSLEVALDKII